MNGWLKGWIKEGAMENEDKKNIGCTGFAFMAVIFLSPLIILMQTASIDAKLDDILKQQREIIENVKYIKRSIKNDTIVYKDEI